MLNVDTRLLNLLNGEELAVFMHILKRIGKTNKSFPSKHTLKQETGFGRERLTKAIKGLKEKKIISAYQQNKEGRYGKIIYTIKTNFAGVYISANNEVLEKEDEEELSDNAEINRDTENDTTKKRSVENRIMENSQVSINKDKSLINLSINKMKEERHHHFKNFNLEFQNDPEYEKYKHLDLKIYFEKLIESIKKKNKIVEADDLISYFKNFVNLLLKNNQEFRLKVAPLTDFKYSQELSIKERQTAFKNDLFKKFSGFYSADELESFYIEACKPAGDGTIIAETLSYNMQTQLNSYLNHIKS